MNPDNNALLTALGAVEKTLRLVSLNVKNTAEAIRDDVAEAAERNRRIAERNRVWQIGIALLLTALLAVVFVGYLTLNATKESTRTTQRTSDAVADCTTPGGQCYESNSARSAALLAQLNRAADERTERLREQVYACNLDPARCTIDTTTSTDTTSTTALPGDVGP